MIFLTAAVAVALVIVVALLLRSFAAERKLWTEERRELLNRIQAPDRIPVAPRPDFVMPEAEPDDWNRVGEIDLSENSDG